MLLRILHRTRYRYHGAIDMAQHMVHLRPVDTASQEVLSHELRIDPNPAARSETTDVFGNQRTFFSLQSTHNMLTVEADSLVQTSAPEPLPEGAPWRAMSWERVREHFRYRAQAPFDAASEFMFASPYVPRDDAFTAFARPAYKAGLPALEAARMLMERIHTELTYETDSTEVNTPALAALAQGKGVCQDFAHIMLGCLRSLGLPLTAMPNAGLPRQHEGRLFYPSSPEHFGSFARRLFALGVSLVGGCCGTTPEHVRAIAAARAAAPRGNGDRNLPPVGERSPG